jgi:hypothetical protein
VLYFRHISGSAIERAIAVILDKFSIFDDLRRFAFKAPLDRLNYWPGGLAISRFPIKPVAAKNNARPPAPAADHGRRQ